MYHSTMVHSRTTIRQSKMPNYTHSMVQHQRQCYHQLIGGEGNAKHTNIRLSIITYTMIGFAGIVTALAVLYVANRKYFSSPFNEDNQR